MTTQVESLPIEVSADQTKAWVHFSELAYDDFNRLESLRPDRVARMLEAGRILPIKNGFLDFRDPSVINDDYGVFSLGVHYRFNPALWKVRRGNSFPYKICTQLVDIGKSSMTLHMQLTNKLDHKELATADFKYVYTNKKTEKSEPFPEWLLDKYLSALRVKQTMIIKRTVPEILSSAYCNDITVAESDVDHNQHTNQASYIRFCFDAANAAIRDGKLQKLEPCINYFPLLELRPVYLSQSWWSDKLQVFVWQDDDSPDIAVHCVIKRLIPNGHSFVIAHCVMVFGPKLLAYL